MNTVEQSSSEKPNYRTIMSNMDPELFYAQ